MSKRIFRKNLYTGPLSNDGSLTLYKKNRTIFCIDFTKRQRVNFWSHFVHLCANFAQAQHFQKVQHTLVSSIHGPFKKSGKSNKQILGKSRNFAIQIKGE